MESLDWISQLLNTVILRPYVFIFLGVSLIAGQRLLGNLRTLRLFVLTWTVGFLAEFSSTRIGIPFGEYAYTGSTRGQELYVFNIPFMDTLSFSFLLFSSYCLALAFALPTVRVGGTWCWSFDSVSRTSWPALSLTVMFFVLSDVVIDPIALRGDQWFLGNIYSYTYQGIYFGVPMSNFAGWAVVGSLSVFLFRLMEHSWYSTQPVPGHLVKQEILLGIGLYYGILAFILGIAFWIGEVFLGMIGVLLYVPVTTLLMVKWWRGDFLLEKAFSGLSQELPD